MMFQDELRELGACPPAVDWVGGRTREDAWHNCERADWMIWFVCQYDLKRGILLACKCARRALRHVPPGENRPLLAIEAAERCASDPTEENRAAARAAYAAADAAEADTGDQDAGPAAQWATACATATACASTAAYAATGDEDAATAAAYAADWAAEAASADQWAAAWRGAADTASAELAEAAEHRAMCDMIRAEVVLEELVQEGQNENG